MYYAYGHHKVADYENWKPVFDSDEQRRLNYGIHVHKLFRSEQDANDVHLIFAVDSLEGFEQCVQDPALGELMQKAGVLEKPEFILLNQAN
jgi:hypothetical protein